MYSDLEVRTQATAEAFVVPTTVQSGMTLYITIKARLEGAEYPTVGEHGFHAGNSVQLVNEQYWIWLGKCPEQPVGGEADDSDDPTPDDVAAAASADEKTLTEDGMFLFCTAITVGEFDEATVLDIPISFWNGTESVSSSLTMAVEAAE